MATAIIPSLLRKLSGGHDRVTVSGRNLREAIADLDRQFPGFRDQFIEDGELKPSLLVSIDGQVGTNGLLDSVGAKSEIFFMPAIAGGS
ncbi:MAG TPA: MoaD/ThiS family protein [Candidatus Binataceae bacterium]|nr:MoaD/ThiS family protein [Candidatus Binataceae bacterium]